MRLVERGHDGEFRFSKAMVGGNTPPYAILSHTWNTDTTEEVAFEDGTGKGKAGYDKDYVPRDGLQYFWVDSWAIDKSNNTELSEAINSMFRRYRDPTRCYVYLSGVSMIGYEQEGKRQQCTWESGLTKE